MKADAPTPAQKPRGRPFKPGNPGRQPGSRNAATKAAEALLEGEAEVLTRKAIEQAKAGDMTALKLCLDRLVPVRRERTISFDMPKVAGAADHPGALLAMLEAVAAGDLTPGEAQALAGILKEHRAAIETAELASRLDALEERISST
ncbi:MULTISPECIES: DUF5681 domain-containing protein [Sphingomonas]|jgi:hypothetical protein|uniref:DUF5681 domain-containing protein n=1 Tax=Sphingomonas hankookensis TaxID=563996 RepID=A0ABR5YBK8_9SPHN|nr:MULTISPECIES: DUF5681 domain-containing protein [Sphingomonas]KZE13439.1 hypothetical protein AVT10_15585 [Sphingomonas hankookensis]PZT90970.1 MAG: hypothetical protein DI625_16820 [Sphingomonas sp.]